jgi:hypothetical protein
MPEYGILARDQGQGLLPWSWARERLERGRNYWLSTTRPDARPHAMAVWGVWLEEGFYFSTGSLSRKARNLEIISACVVCTERADEAVIVEGIAEMIRDPSTLERLTRVYTEKYEMPFPSDSGVYLVRPKVAFGFIENAAEFQGSATRWRFS